MSAPRQFGELGIRRLSQAEIEATRVYLDRVVFENAIPQVPTGNIRYDHNHPAHGVLEARAVYETITLTLPGGRGRYLAHADNFNPRSDAHPPPDAFWLKLPPAPDVVDFGWPFVSDCVTYKRVPVEAVSPYEFEDVAAVVNCFSAEPELRLDDDVPPGAVAYRDSAWLREVRLQIFKHKDGGSTAAVSWEDGITLAVRCPWWIGFRRAPLKPNDKRKPILLDARRVTAAQWWCSPAWLEMEFDRAEQAEVQP